MYGYRKGDNRFERAIKNVVHGKINGTEAPEQINNEKIYWGGKNKRVKECEQEQKRKSG